MDSFDIFTSPLKKNIYFDEAEHKYTDDDNTVYTSVTTLIKKYEIPFEREYWLNYKANKLGIDKDELSDHWNKLTVDACEKGSEKHLYLENNVNAFYSSGDKSDYKSGIGFSFKGKVKVVNLDFINSTDLKYKHPKIYKFLLNLIDWGYTLFAEKRIYNASAGVCGTIDLFAVRGNEFRIVDWKTNKKPLYFRSGYYKKNRFGIETSNWINKNETFKYPLNNVPFCKGEVYTLQLSLYALLAELFGFTCTGLHLWHIRDTEDIMYNIKYRKEECKLMLIHNYNNR